MNSHSKYSLHEETSNRGKDEDCDCKHPAPRGVILETEYGNFGPLDITFALGTSTQTFNQPIASVTIDTACLNNADVLIDFIGILNVTTTVAATSTLTFTLSKICNGYITPQTIATTNFFVADVTGGVTTSHTLALRYPLKNDDCRDCCTYVLALSSIFNLDFGTITYAINGTISALAIDSSH